MERRLTKREVERLVRAIDTEHLFAEVLVALRLVLQLDQATPDLSVLHRAAHTAGWADDKLAAAVGRDESVLSALAIELSELRSLVSAP